MDSASPLIIYTYYIIHWAKELSLYLFFLVTFSIYYVSGQISLSEGIGIQAAFVFNRYWYLGDECSSPLLPKQSLYTSLNGCKGVHCQT